jgi:GR25 family glycosyltransferase involved in LPS biosynthesis
MDGRVVVINLDRDADRLAQFRADNAHLPQLERFAAFDGLAVDRDACIRQGLVTHDNRYTRPALGCALSHVALWRQCAAGCAPLTICEDDAVLHPHFLAGRARILAALPQDWDIVQWGWNLDWPMAMDLGSGMPNGIVKCPEAAPRPDLAAFRAGRLRFQAFPLRSSSGFACYTLSVAGAARLLARCLPLGAETPMMAEHPTTRWENSGVDVEASRHYPSMRAFVCVPPLAISPNVHALSSIRGPRAETAALVA